MSAQPHSYISPEEYLALDEASDCRNEYYYGHMYAMAGGAPAHGTIIGNLIRTIGNALMGRPCRVIPNDLRVRLTPETYAYPDLVVACGDMKLAKDSPNTLLNPTVLIEVLSPSTELVDREFKSQRYRSIESLQQYALVSQTKPQIELFTRQPSGDWLLSEFSGLESACRFESLGCEIPLADIYYQISFEPES